MKYVTISADFDLQARILAGVNGLLRFEFSSVKFQCCYFVECRET